MLYLAMWHWGNRCEAVGADPVLLCIKECKQTGGAVQRTAKHTQRVESRGVAGVCMSGGDDGHHPSG